MSRMEEQRTAEGWSIRLTAAERGFRAPGLLSLAASMKKEVRQNQI